MRMCLKKNYALVLGVIFAFIIRILPLIINGEQALFRPDSYDYLRLAHDIANKGHYGNGEIFRAPGYPLFLTVFYSTSGSVIFVSVIQILLDIGTCLLTFSLILRITQNRKTALTGFFAMVFSMSNVAFSILILSEALYAFLLVLFLNLFYKFFTDKDTPLPEILLLSIILICLIYVRAISTLFFPIVILSLLILKKYKVTAIFTLLVILFCGIWVIRNSLVANYNGFSSVSSINLYRYNACLLLAKKNGISVSEQRVLIDQEFQSLASQNEVVALAKRKGLSTILANPFQYSYLHLKSNLSNFAPAFGDYLKNCGLEIGGNNTLSVIQSEGVIAGLKNYLHGKYWVLFLLVPATVILLIVYFAMGNAIYSKVRFKSFTKFDLFLILTFLYFMMVPGPASHPRFRVPMGPIIAYFASIGMSNFLKRKDQPDKLFENDKASA